MIKVYCERGALRKELKDLKKKGLIQLIHFPYEGNTKKIEVTNIPSVVTTDTTHITADNDQIFLGDCVSSDKFDLIKKVIGNHEFDARHIDTAYKNKCRFFLSRDKDDIVGHSLKLKELLDIEFLHPDDDWDYFLSQVK
jgi:hypothetical protein